MIDKIKQHIEEAKAFNEKNKESLEQFRIKYLGSKGLLKELFTEFKNIPNDQKKDFGQVINTLKAVAEEKVKQIQEELESKEESKGIFGDLTRAEEPVLIGSRHPISIVKNQIIDIFANIGFNVSEGPEIEDDWHNFTALNLPEYHPARDMQDTFSFRQILMCCCVRIHHLFRCVIWKIINRQFVPFLRDVFSVMKPFHHVRTVFSIK